MSMTWEKVRLGDILRKSDETIDPNGTTEYREITVRLWGRGIVERGRVIGASLSGRRFVARAGQFIASRIDARNGAMGLVPTSLDGALVTNDFLLFIIEEQCLLPGFLGWLCRTGDFIELCLRASEGTTNRVRLKEGRFFALEIPLPPIEEQRRIVARIEKLSAQIAEARSLRHQATEEAEALGKSILKQELTATAEKYGVQPMGQVAKCAAGFGFPKQHQGRTGLKYPFLKVSDMNLPENQRAITTAQNWVGDDDVRDLRLRIYPVGTIIFPKIGGAIATNKRRVLSLPGTFDNNVMGLIPYEKLLTEYLFAFMQSFDLTELQAGTSVPAISQGKVEALEIPVPPLPEQRRIVAYLDGLQAELDALKRLQAETAAELDALLPAILDRAFKGEL